MAVVTSETTEEPILVLDHDRWANAHELEVESSTLRPLHRARVEGERVYGWFVRRQRRVQALIRINDRLTYMSGRRAWDIEQAKVQRRSVGPYRSLRFEDADGTIGTSRWLDWELARRWFIPKALDLTGHPDDIEDFDWAVFVDNVLSDERRTRIGRPR